MAGALQITHHVSHIKSHRFSFTFPFGSEFNVQLASADASNLKVEL